MKDATQNISKIHLDIEGMSCAACSSSIEKALKRRDFIKSVEIFLISNKATISFDADKTNTESIINLIEKIGYKAKASSEIKKENTSKNIFYLIETKILTASKRLILSIILTLIILYVSMFAHMLHAPLGILEDIYINAIFQLILTLVVAHMGRDFYIKGLKLLFKLSPNMDTLVALGSMSGFLYSSYFVVFKSENLSLSNLYYEGVCVIITFIMIGKYIEISAKNKALENANKLLHSKEYKVFKLIDKKEIEIDSKDIKISDVIKILPNSYIPSDGILLGEYALVNESQLTGESLPISKRRGDIVYSGSINTNQSIIIQASVNFEDSTISKIQKLIQSAISSKAQIASMADKISSYFVPTVIFLALISGLYWLLNEGIERAMLVFASTLLISCPCSLGLATPLAILFANAKSNKFGIFFKNSQSLENASKINNIFFDKTGTLTTGQLQVQEILSFSSLNSEKIYQIIKSIESNSEHIIAKAIKGHKDTKTLEILDYENIIGEGIKAKLNLEDGSEPTQFIVGNIKMFSKDLQEKYNYILNKENIVIFLGTKNEFEENILGAIILEDRLKNDARYTINELKGMGLSISILSGDNEKSVAKIANMLGINYLSNCSPQDKLTEIKKLKARGEKAIMVGDGTNDAAALAHSAVSISMGNGSDLSIENSDIIIFNEKLDSILKTIKLSKSTLKIIKQNLTFAFLYNILCIPIAMGIFSKYGLSLSPMYASIAMSLSSISVVLNSSRLYYVKIK